MARINSRAKGCRAELAWCAFLREHGWTARRGCQHSAVAAETGKDSPDVVCPDLSWLHFEVKHVERLNIQDAMDQAKRDAGDKVPVVAHKKNHCPWLIPLPAEEFVRALRGDWPLE